jgi:hypothetical protein
MSSQIKVDEIYDSNVNFLIGAGASFGMFPTLELRIKDAQGQAQTIETLATRFDQAGDQQRHTLLFMHYYRHCVHPVCDFSLDAATGATEVMVVTNYRRLLETVVQMLDRRKPMERRCNIFTTNYDGLFPFVADAMIQQGAFDFCINDGTRGFGRKVLQARNFNTFLCQAGVFDQHRSSVPQVNLIQLHGSAYWRKWHTSIEVDYRLRLGGDFIPAEVSETVDAFSALLNSDASPVENLTKLTVDQAHRSAFWAAYHTLPIVNPTKWKFHETVFEEHYYQMLRLLSYELEKPNAVLITFGFSFADEHILHLVKRSLSNPRLQLFVCCFNASELTRMKATFSMFKNVELIAMEDGVLDFTRFNDEVFSIRKHLPVGPESAETAQTTGPVVI